VSVKSADEAGKKQGDLTLQPPLEGS